MVGEIHRNSYANRLVEGSIGIAYSDDSDRAIEVIGKAIGEFPGVASEPVAQIGIEAFGDSSITIAYRFWIPTPSYFETQYAVNRGVFKALREAEVTIPLPQREIRMLGAAS